MTQKNVIKKKKISKSKSRYSSQSSTRKSSEVDSDTKDVTEEENANQSTLMTNNGNNGAASFRRSKSANKIAMGLARSLKKVSVSGSVHGRNVIIVDDMIDTGITLKNAVEVKYILIKVVMMMMGRSYFPKIKSYWVILGCSNVICRHVPKNQLLIIKNFD